ncbi:MAG TPA: lasso peptide biosynthesis B2 protein [Tepidisphaeraceae bacterium]|nr:lasso peptide biosynthesis B2 protein [Tepidisphaeraceae bacterium]
MACWMCSARPWNELLSLEPRRQRLLLESAVLIAISRIGLRCLPFRWMHRWIERESFTRRSRRARSSSESIEEIVWAIEIASRAVPASCLAQAMAGTILLGRRGHSVSLHLGVVRGPHETLGAHAWVECDCKVVLGRNDRFEEYTALGAINRRAG